jgi:hypothetical protein
MPGSVASFGNCGLFTAFETKVDQFPLEGTQATGQAVFFCPCSSWPQEPRVLLEQIGCSTHQWSYDRESVRVPVGGESSGDSGTVCQVWTRGGLALVPKGRNSFLYSLQTSHVLHGSCLSMCLVSGCEFVSVDITLPISLCPKKWQEAAVHHQKIFFFFFGAFLSMECQQMEFYYAV